MMDQWRAGPAIGRTSTSVLADVVGTEGLVEIEVVGTEGPVEWSLIGCTCNTKRTVGYSEIGQRVGSVEIVGPQPVGLRKD